PEPVHAAGAPRASAGRPHGTAAAGASAMVDDAGPAKPPVQPLYAQLSLSDMTADLSAVKTAYKEASLKNHPDKNVGNEAEATERCKVVSNAFKILSDPESRKKYDKGPIDEKGDQVHVGFFDDRPPCDSISGDCQSPKYLLSITHPP
ncbi:J domain-containing protein, partial [Pseudomonas syringae]